MSETTATLDRALQIEDRVKHTHSLVKCLIERPPGDIKLRRVASLICEMFVIDASTDISKLINREFPTLVNLKILCQDFGHPLQTTSKKFYKLPPERLYNLIMNLKELYLDCNRLEDILNTPGYEQKIGRHNPLLIGNIELTILSLISYPGFTNKILSLSDEHLRNILLFFLEAELLELFKGYFIHVVFNNVDKEEPSYDKLLKGFSFVLRLSLNTLLENPDFTEDEALSVCSAKLDIIKFSPLKKTELEKLMIRGMGPKARIAGYEYKVGRHIFNVTQDAILLGKKFILRHKDVNYGNHINFHAITNMIRYAEVEVAINTQLSMIKKLILRYSRQDQDLLRNIVMRLQSLQKYNIAKIIKRLSLNTANLIDCITYEHEKHDKDIQPADLLYSPPESGLAYKKPRIMILNAKKEIEEYEKIIFKVNNDIKMILLFRAKLNNSRLKLNMKFDHYKDFSEYLNRTLKSAKDILNRDTLQAVLRKEEDDDEVAAEVTLVASSGRSKIDICKDLNVVCDVEKIQMLPVEAMPLLRRCLSISILMADFIAYDEIHRIFLVNATSAKLSKKAKMKAKRAAKKSADATVAKLQRFVDKAHNIIGDYQRAIEMLPDRKEYSDVIRVFGFISNCIFKIKEISVDFLTDVNIKDKDKLYLEFLNPIVRCVIQPLVNLKEGVINLAVRMEVSKQTARGKLRSDAPKPEIRDTYVLRRTVEFRGGGAGGGGAGGASDAIDRSKKFTWGMATQKMRGLGEGQVEYLREILCASVKINPQKLKDLLMDMGLEVTPRANTPTHVLVVGRLFDNVDKETFLFSIMHRSDSSSRFIEDKGTKSQIARALKNLMHAEIFIQLYDAHRAKMHEVESVDQTVRRAVSSPR